MRLFNVVKILQNIQTPPFMCTQESDKENSQKVHVVGSRIIDMEALADGFDRCKTCDKGKHCFMNRVSTEARLFSFEFLLVQFYIVFQRFIQKKLNYNYNKALKSSHYLTPTTTSNYTVYKVSNLTKIHVRSLK